MGILREKTQQLLETIALEVDGVMGIHAFDPTNPEEEFVVYADEIFPAASIIKIPILLEFYRQVAEGTLDLNEVYSLNDKDKYGGSGVLKYLSDKTKVSLEDLVKLMINLSDNTATNYLIDIVGFENVNRLLEILGLVDTKLLRKMQMKDIDPDLQENLSTPRELSNLLHMIMNRKGLDENVCRKALEVLKLHKQGIIRDAIPRNYVVANKAGWMDAIECDTSIVYAEKPYIVTVMTKHISKWDVNKQKTKESMKQVVSIIHDYYQNKFTSSKYGRRIT
jgi:beta-lactamase class A